MIDRIDPETDVASEHVACTVTVMRVETRREQPTEVMMSDIAMSSYVVATSSTGGKFWEIEVEGCDVRTRYGKVGQTKKWSTKTYSSAEEALKQGTSALRKKMNKGYAKAPRPIVIAEGYTEKKLAEIPLGGIFYFRALDRYPGGNADMFTTKIMLRVLPGQPPVMRTKQYRNWDGQHHEYAEVGVSLDMTETLPAFLDAAQALIATGASQETFTVQETRYDREEYDTEWSSIEFILYALPDESAEDIKIEEGAPIVHVRQTSVTYSPKAPEGAFAEFFDASMKLAGVGRVEQHSESADAFNKACGAMKTVSKKWSNADVPIYL